MRFGETRRRTIPPGEVEEMYSWMSDRDERTSETVRFKEASPEERKPPDDVR